jgi:ATP-dependent Lhr-like helicase
VFLFDPEKLSRLVRDAVGNSALFAARFRERPRALLMPGRTPGRRSPLWQQRLRAGQLLEIARGYADFPILLETVRECLQDVYDLPALDRLMRRLNTGEVQISAVTTATPSPFAASLLFGYVAEFMYESDAPLAERRASVLSLDSELLGNLLGQADPGELLDPSVIRRIEEELQRLAPERKARGKEGLFDLLRELGPMTLDDLAARHRESREAVSVWLDELLAERRAFTLTIGESQRIACMDDAARLRDALGVRLPADLPDAWLNPVATPLADLFLRYVQTHTLFTVQQIAHAFGLGVAVAQEALEKLREQGKVMRLRAGQPAPGQLHALSSSDWVGEEIFRRLRIRSLQAAREATRPVPATAFTRLLLERQGLLAGSDGSPAFHSDLSGGVFEGVDGVLRVIEQLAGLGLPATLWESQILPARARLRPGDAG